MYRERLAAIGYVFTGRPGGEAIAGRLPPRDRPAKILSGRACKTDRVWATHAVPIDQVPQGRLSRGRPRLSRALALQTTINARDRRHAEHFFSAGSANSAVPLPFATKDQSLDDVEIVLTNQPSSTGRVIDARGQAAADYN
jgi:hypothetical protein